MAKMIIEDGLDDIVEGRAAPDDERDMDDNFDDEGAEYEVDEGDQDVGAGDDDDDERMAAAADDDVEPEGRAEPDDDGKAARAAGEDDDLEGYSNKVRKRIERERRLKETERQRAERAEAELARLQAERDEASIEERIATAVQELEDARADADTRKEALAYAKVGRLAAEKDAIEARRNNRTTDKPAPNEAYAAWLERNGWFDKPEHRRLRASAIAIASDLMEAEGLTDDSDALYRRLDQELRKTVRLPGREPPPRTTLNRRAEGRDSGTARRGPMRVVITEREKAEMRRFGLDPSNPAALKEYARNKLEERNNG